MVLGGMLFMYQKRLKLTTYLEGGRRLEVLCQNRLSWLTLSVSEPLRLLLAYKLCKKGDFLFSHSITTSCENLFHYSKEMSIDQRLLILWKLCWRTSSLVRVSHAIIGENTIFSNKPWSSYMKSTLTTLLWILLVCSGKGAKDLGFGDVSNQTEET